MYNSQFPILQYNHWLNKQKDKFVNQTKNGNLSAKTIDLCKSQFYYPLTLLAWFFLEIAL